MRRPASEKSKSNAKRLRKSMTKPEVFLWTEFRKWREQGVNIRRQVPIGPYIADFAHLNSYLVIEVDGKSHNETQIEYDAERQKFIESKGYTVVRISNDDALFRTDQVAQHIWNLIHDRKT
jgi:very-short-patch-repair endonuclease